jgi:hypothetical protein
MDECCLFYVICYMYMGRADRTSRRVQTTVARRCVLSRNLVKPAGRSTVWVAQPGKKYHPSHMVRYQSIPLPMLCCSSHTINIFMSPLPHNKLSINSITKIMLSISHYKHPYVIPPTRSVTNQFHYQCYALHLTLYTS